MSRPAPGNGRMALLAAAGGALAFLAVWTALHHGAFTHDAISDLPIYQAYGEQVMGGALPYRDFHLEYPPGALPAFVVPALAGGSYARRFELLLGGVGAAMVALSVLGAARLGASRRRLALVAAAGALLPLALGPVVVSRFDLWPAALTAAALALVLAGRPRLGLAVLGVAVAAKVYPLVIVPLVLVHLLRTRGRRQAVGAGACCAAAFLAVVLPFAALSPSGLWWALVRQASRPLQVESLGGAALLAGARFAGLGFHMVASDGSHNLVGTAASGVSIVIGAVLLLSLVAVWVGYARGPADAERLVRFATAAVCTTIAFGKVLSPQYLVWLIPLVPLVGGRRGLRATGMLLLACLLTQAWFPYRYTRLVAPVLHDGALPGGREVVLVCLRDVVLIALLGELVWSQAWRRAVRRAVVAVASTASSSRSSSRSKTTP